MGVSEGENEVCGHIQVQKVALRGHWPSLDLDLHLSLYMCFL